jgi:hypothetical protein
MKITDIKQAEDLIIEHIELIKSKWDEIAMIEKTPIENNIIINLAYSI